MSPESFVVCWMMAGLTIAAVVHWRDGRRPPWAVIVGIVCLWPLLLISLAGWIVYDAIRNGADW